MHRVHSSTVTKLERKQLWQNILIEFDNSGLKPTAFCRKHEIKYDHFSYYLNERKRKSNEISFVPIKIVPSAEPVLPVIKLKWHDIEIDLPAEFNQQQIIDFIKALRASTC